MNKKSEIKNALVLIQTILATSVFALAIGYLFEKEAYLFLLEILLSMLVFILAYNNYKYYKLKYVTQICVIIGILSVLGVFIFGK